MLTITIKVIWRRIEVQKQLIQPVQKRLNQRTCDTSGTHPEVPELPGGFCFSNQTRTFQGLETAVWNQFRISLESVVCYVMGKAVMSGRACVSFSDLFGISGKTRRNSGNQGKLKPET
ncbi:MAG: hypothetical protein IPL78_20630 [Chloroflexi bacterium]|nr:hypothetical protein [Chloroflexota bacterium]